LANAGNDAGWVTVLKTWLTFIIRDTENQTKNRGLWYKATVYLTRTRKGRKERKCKERKKRERKEEQGYTRFINGRNLIR
jgi:hypothetical protein